MVITVGIDGMMCGMCESHVCETVRKNFDVRKVTASTKKGQCQITCDLPISREQLKAALDPTGYVVTSYEVSEEKQKKGLFGRK